MGLSRSETIALVSLIAGYDNRFANDTPTIASWGRAAATWDFDAALAAVERFYTRPIEANESLPRIAPGHIAELMRQTRPGGRGPAPARELLAGRGTGSTPEHRRALVDAYRAEQLAKRRERGDTPLPRVRAREPWVAPEPKSAPDQAIPVDEAKRQVRAMFTQGRMRAQDAPAAFGSRVG